MWNTQDRSTHFCTWLWLFSLLPCKPRTIRLCRRDMTRLFSQRSADRMASLAAITYSLLRIRINAAWTDRRVWHASFAEGMRSDWCVKGQTSWTSPPSMMAQSRLPGSESERNCFCSSQKSSIGATLGGRRAATAGQSTVTAGQSTVTSL